MLSPRRVASVTCDLMRVPLSEFMGNSRHRRVVLARRACAVVARERSLLSCHELATAMGRAYSTTYRLCESGLRLREERPEFALLCALIGFLAEPGPRTGDDRSA